jgi:tetratricopeptide (TPR) repeat protein
MGVGDVRPLRGRRRELALVGNAIARASEGRPSAIVLVGEPGIGKSRLAIEAAAHATAAGMTTLWGRAWEAGGAPAYWPWRQLCDDFSRDGAIAQLWGGRDSAATDADQARFEVFDAVARALARRATERPLMCIFDDLHAADVPSLELVAFATRHLTRAAIAWLLTWRDAEGSFAAVREPLARIAREATVVPLAALDDCEANQLIDDAHRDADVELRARLVRATAGNPLFLLETLAAVASGRSSGAAVARLPIAQGIAMIVRDRLALLSVEARALALAASAIGRDVSLARWAAAADRDADAIRRAAAAFVDAGLLVAIDRDRWRFDHELVREAIYRGAPESEVVAIHDRLARDLDARIAAGDTSLVGERAHHALHARGDVRTALAWAVAAADDARRQCACEEALAVLDLAIAHLGDDAERDPRVQLARGQALLDLGRTSDANAAFDAAAGLARAAGDARMAAIAVLGRGARYVFGDHQYDLIARIDEAIADLPASECTLHARLVARKAAALMPAPDAAPVIAMAREALAIVAGCDDDAARLEVAVAVGSAFAEYAHPRERVANNETLVALARRRGDRALELRGLSRLITDHIMAGELARADELLDARDALARALVQPRFVWDAPLFRSMRAMMSGDFATCDAALAAAKAFAGRDPNAARVCAVHRMWVAFHADRVDEMRAHEPVLLDAIKTMSGRNLTHVVRAVVRVRTGELDDARRELAHVDIDASKGRSLNHIATFGEAIAEIGSDDARRIIYDALVPSADCFAAYGLFGLTCGPPVAATLGHLASALGEHDRARTHFEAALALATAKCAWVGRAWTNYWYGRALARIGADDAARVLDDAIRDATRANIPSLAERCRAIEVGARPVAAAAHLPTPAYAWTIEAHAGSWRVRIADREFLVPDLLGMPMLARLAASPHVEIHSLELVTGSASDEVDRGDAGEALDARARAAYRARAVELADKIEDAESRGDVERAESARDERDALVKELSRAVGIAGKVRRTGAASERARVAAQRRLREAIKKIGELDDELGRHLTKAIRTGTFCAYRP